MPVDRKKLKQRQADAVRGGELTKFTEGREELIYLHGSCEPDDQEELTKDLPWIEVAMHYGLGADIKSAVCLDKDHNPILAHPRVQEFMKERKVPPIVDMDAGCPVCQKIPDMTSEERSERARQVRYLWGMTSIGSRRRRTDDFDLERSPKPAMWMGGTTIHTGFQDAFSDDDITNMDGAMYVIVGREGTGKRGTKYKIEKDSVTIKNPVKLPKPLRAEIRLAMKNDCNLFRTVANNVRSTDELRAALAGVAIAEDERAEPEAEEPPEGGRDYQWEKGTPKPKPCFAEPEDIADDDECAACDYKWNCAELCDVAVPGEKPEPEPEPEPESEPPENETKGERRARLNRAKEATAKAGDHPSGLTREELGQDGGDDEAKLNAELDQVEGELKQEAKRTKGSRR